MVDAQKKKTFLYVPIIVYEIFFWVTIANDVLLRLANPCLLAYLFGDGSQIVYNLLWYNGFCLFLYTHNASC